MLRNSADAIQVRTTAFDAIAALHVSERDASSLCCDLMYLGSFAAWKLVAVVSVLHHYSMNVAVNVAVNRAVNVAVNVAGVAHAQLWWRCHSSTHATCACMLCCTMRLPPWLHCACGSAVWHNKYSSALCVHRPGPSRNAVLNNLWIQQLGGHA